MEEIRENYLAWLRDAHAMEEQALTMMQGMLSRLENYPALSARIRAHISETERQEATLRQMLEARASDTSMLKDLMGKMTAGGQALSGLFASDEVVKGSMASYTFEHMEIAAYQVLIATARALGDGAAVAEFEKILAEEQAMADWLAAHLPETTSLYLTRDAANLTAGR